jgi:hypothetical protein
MSQTVFDDAVIVDQPADTGAPQAPFGGAMFVMPDGTWVREGSKEFFAALEDPDPDYDAARFAVTNLGFIAVRVIPNSVVDIKFHPRNVTAAALVSIQHLLQSMRSDLFRISYLNEYWQSETVSSARQILCRISEICALKGVGITPFEDTFLSNTTEGHTGALSLPH